MATTGYTKNFVVKNGITVGPITLDASSGNIAGSNASLTANLSVTGVSNLGAVGNIIITGGTGGYVLSTNGSGNLSWIAQSGGGGGTSISNGNSNVNIATANGNITFSAIGNANVMTVTGTGANINGTLSISGDANAGNIGATNGVFTNVSGNGSSLSSITGANITGTVANATSAGTVTTAAQPNITSTGTLTSLSVSGNANVGNIGATGGVFTTVTGTLTTAAQPNITSTGTLASLSVTGTATAGNLATAGTLSAGGNANVGNLGTTALVATGTGSFGGNVNLNSFNITSLATPVADTDAATKAYVDTVAQGLDTKASVVAATTANITLTGTQTIDGVAVTAGQRVLVKNQTAPAENGLYLCAAGSWTRTTDMTTWAQVPGAYVFVEGGSTQADTGWVCTSDAGGTIGVTAMTWAQFSGAGSYTAGTGLTLTGTVFSANASQTQITAVGTLTSLSVSGNANIGNIGTGGLITATGNITGGNISGTLLTGTLTTAAQPNITSTGTLASLSVTGNANVGNIGATNIVGTLTTAAQPNITSTGTLASLSVSGNATIGNIVSSGTGGNISGANVISANLFTGTLTTAAQPNITSTGTLASLSVTGNVNAGNANLGNAATANFFIGSGENLSNIQGGNVTGAVTYATNANSVAGANVSGFVANADYANLATYATTANSVAGANVSGAVSFATTANSVAVGNVSGIGNISTVNIDGNSSNVLYGNGVFATAPGGGGGTPGGSNTQIQFNDASSFGGNTGFTFNKTTGVFSAPSIVVSGNITPSANITYSLGNTTNRFNNLYLAGNTIDLGGAIISANATAIVFTNPQGGTFAVTGNSTTSDSNLGNVATANYFVGSGNGLANIQAANVSGTVTYATYAVTASAANSVAVGNVAGIGNISTVNIDGNAGNVLYGNGVFATAPGGGGGTYGNSNVATFLASYGSNTITTTGNVSVGNIIGNGQALTNIAGANVTGTVANATYAVSAGTVTTNAQPNITSTGTLASLSVSGNATIGNIVSSGTGGNISGANVISANLFTGTLTTNAQPNITSTGTLTSLSVSGNANTGNLGTNNFIATGTGSFSANVNMNSQWINNVGYPNLETDAASKLYVDTLVSTGVSYHQPVNVATTTTLAVATGGTTAYNSPNGAANGIGAYISTTGTFLNIDSANVQTVGTRILVKDEANAAWNGVYTYANTTAIVRSTDTDEYGAGSTTLLSINDYFFTLGGVVNEGTAFIVSAPAGTITFGTSNIVFSTFSTSQVYDAGTGIAITGTTISANASQTQITAVGTLTSLSVSGNANVGNIGASAGVFTTIAGSLTTAAQPNITSTGTLSSLSVSGTTSLGAVGNVTITGGTNGQVLTTDGSNVLSWTTVSGGGSSASISNGTSNVNITTANGNINTSVNGVANVLVITGTGANIAGTLNVTGTIVPRVVAITDATSVTMNGDTTDIASQINTQAVGTLTVNAVTGTLVDGQKIIFRLKSTNVQTFSWNAVFQGSTELALPTTSTGSNQYDYMGFIYNSIAAKWQYMAKNFGF